MLPSKFGYIVTGKCPGGDHDLPISTLFVSTVNFMLPGATSHCLSGTFEPVDKLRSLEIIGIADPMIESDDDLALHKFCESVRFEDGRYQIKWPWKESNVCLPDNYPLALRRMKSLVKRLQSDQVLLRKYDDIICQQLDRGIIERIDNSVLSGTRKHYLPHHPVLTPAKATTKVRVVYDASAKSQKFVSSLNDCLFCGPVILPDLVGLLIRFRLHSIVILADLEKAFLQIGVQEDERDVTRFLWLKDINKSDVSDNNIAVYRFCTVPFGLICSPFLLGATLKHHLLKEGTPLALDIMSNIYVDNVLIGTDSVEQTFSIYQEAKEIFRKVSMNLREWNSNAVEFLEFLSADERVSSADGKVKVLGPLWNVKDDLVHIPGVDRVMMDGVVTKRDVLNIVAKIFDPLGLVTPVTFHGKVFLQTLWKLSKSWDEPLSGDLVREWNQILKMLISVSNLSIKRLVENQSKGVNQLLVFCDASTTCYATTIYLRTCDGTTAKTNLVFAKMHLVPTGKEKSKSKAKLKKFTIPRLELLAVLIGVRAVSFVEHEMKLSIEEKFLWTDSQCVLHWIKTTKPLSVFVENRVKEIKLHRDLRLRYIASGHNPADLATRGLSVSELCECSLWWHDPSWLGTNHLSWPAWNLPEITVEKLEQIETEVRRSRSFIELANVAGVDQLDDKQLFLFGLREPFYSSLRKLLRVSVYVLRFIKLKVWRKIDGERFKHRLMAVVLESLSEGFISRTEIKMASILWIYSVQQSYFNDVFLALKNNKKHCLQKQLGLKTDQFGIL